MGFVSLHPAITFGWFICAILLTVMVANPLWMACAFVGAAAYYLSVRGRSGWNVVLGLIPVFVALSLANGLFNPRGSTVLFTYFDRPYTLEAVLYGSQTAGMFVTVMLLFGSYNRVMTADRFTYLFGGVRPALTLVLTMVLRLVPSYMRKAKQIAGARDCIGKGAAEGGFGGRACHGADVLGALTTWALEAGVVTADSMRSRGYGASPRRTQYACYRFGLRDGLVLAVAIVFACLALAGILQGASGVEYLPQVELPSVTPFGILSLLAFAAFLFIPSTIDLRERISWRNSISRI